MAIPDNEIQLALVTENEANTLTEMIRKYYDYDQILFDEAEIRLGLVLLLNDQSLGRAWLIIRKRQPVGYVILTFGFDLEFGGRLATITDLFLEREHRGKGLGRRTIEHIEEFCRATGIQALELQPERDNEEALAFYRNVGFHTHDRVPMSKRILSPRKPAA